MSNEDRNALRMSLREQRIALSDEEQDAASSRLFKLVGAQDFFRVAQNIAFYSTIDGEINPNSLRELALSEGKSCALPTLSKDSPDFVTFLPYTKDAALQQNDWGTAEPTGGDPVPPTDFDLVFVPLVGFTASCFRLGMGKGFYDRTFSFKIFNRRSRPLLVGLAYDFQKIDSVKIESWDVRLDLVVTDKKIYRPENA